jgi:aspartate/methionine/tyrosine aminotransferase
MPTTSNRTAGFGESVIRRMTRVANEYDAVNLSQGFPDFDPRTNLRKRSRELRRTGRINTPLPGARPVSGKRSPKNSRASPPRDRP